MRLIYTLLILSLSFTTVYSQKERVMNQPYADLKRYHLGFHIGLHTQDLILTNTGLPTVDGKTLFAEIRSYSPGFSVGVIGDMYLSRYLNLRFVPTINFGSKKVRFKSIEDSTYEETTLRSNYLSFPLSLKFSSLRMNNVRPYLTGGVYGAFDLGRKKSEPLLMKAVDYGLEIGLGCDIYLPFFKLCPELKFSFGLADLLEKKRPDLREEAQMIYTNALSKARSRMITLTFNFE